MIDPRAPRESAALCWTWSSSSAAHASCWRLHTAIMLLLLASTLGSSGPAPAAPTAEFRAGGRSSAAAAISAAAAAISTTTILPLPPAEDGAPQLHGGPAAATVTISSAAVPGGTEVALSSSPPPPLCTEPLTTPLPKRHLFAFAKPDDEPSNTSAWRSWDWSRLTTIGLAQAPPPGFVCHAHANGVRVIQNVGVFSSPGRCAVGQWKPGNSFWPLEVGGCPTGQLIDRVVFASYGNPRGDCAHGFAIDPACDNTNSMALAEKTCVGKSRCRFVYSKEWQQGGNKCEKGTRKRLAVVVHCTGDPPPSPPGPLPPAPSPGNSTLGIVPLAAFSTVQARREWIAQQLTDARHYGLDGLSIDIETSSATTRSILTSLVQEAAAVFRSANPHALLAFSVSMYPSADGKTDGLLGMDYAAIAEQVDVLFIMGYDTAGVPPVAFGGGRATAIGAAAAEYVRLGVAADKIVIGVLPGGVDYSCNVSAAPSSVGCVVPVDPSNGKPSHAAMVNRVFSFPTRDWPGPTVVQLLTWGNISGRLAWDNATSLPFFDYIDQEGAWHQVWFEDAQSICVKQQLVSRMQLGGMGLFLADFLSGQTNRTQRLWGALVRDKSVCTTAVPQQLKSDDDHLDEPPPIPKTDGKAAPLGSSGPAPAEFRAGGGPSSAAAAISAAASISATILPGGALMLRTSIRPTDDVRVRGVGGRGVELPLPFEP